MTTRLLRLRPVLLMPKCFTSTRNRKNGPLSEWEGMKRMLLKAENKLAKKIARSQSKRKGIEAWATGDQIIQATSRTVTASVRETRRQKHLTVLLHEQISLLLSNGFIDDAFITNPIEITQVKLARDFSNISVLWKASGYSTEDDKVQGLLLQHSKSIRAYLSSMQLIGGPMPFIQFLKDLSDARREEVEAALAKADFGEDYTPSSSVRSLESDFRLPSDLSQRYLKQLNDPNPPNIQEANDDFVQAACNDSAKDLKLQTVLYGINQDDMMQQVLRAKSRQRTAETIAESGLSADERTISPSDIQKLLRKRQRPARSTERAQFQNEAVLEWMEGHKKDNDVEQ